MRSELHAVRDIALRYRQTSLRMKMNVPLALTTRGIEAAWREYAKDHPELTTFKDEFVRIARGEG